MYAEVSCGRLVVVASESQAKSLIQQLSMQIENISADYQKAAEEAGFETQWSVLVACAVLAVITISIFIMISVSLTRSLTQTKNVMDRLSQGALD